MVLTFEITSSSDERTLLSKLEIMERVLHYSVHEAVAFESKDTSSSSSSSYSFSSSSSLCNAVLHAVGMAGFGLKSVGDWRKGTGACVVIRKLLNGKALGVRLPCVKAMHDAGQLYFFVQPKVYSTETASNSSTLSSLRRQLEVVELRLDTNDGGGALAQQLRDLSELHNQGILSKEEFSNAKAKVLER